MSFTSDRLDAAYDRAFNKEADKYFASSKDPLYDGLDDDQEREYAEWLQLETDLMIGNGDTLLKHVEAGTYFDDFVEYYREKYPLKPEPEDRRDYEQDR